MLVCSNVAEDAIDDDDLAAEQLHQLAARAADRGLRIAYEALAWGRHVSEYDHSWRIVAARRSPRPRRLPGQLPHPLARRPTSRRSPRSRARRSSSCSWPTPRGCGWTSCSGAGTTAASPARAASTSPTSWPRSCTRATAGRSRSRSSTTSSVRRTPIAWRSTRCARCSLLEEATHARRPRAGALPRPRRLRALPAAPTCAATPSRSSRWTPRSSTRPRGCWRRWASGRRPPSLQAGHALARRHGQRAGQRGERR